MASTTTASMNTAKPSRDVRSLWRVLLALVLPLPWLAKGVQYAVGPSASDDVLEQIKIFTTNHSYAWLQWLDATFVILVVPSVATLAWVSRRGAPRLATVGALLAVTGFLAGISSGSNGDQIAWIAAQKHYDPDLISKFSDDLEATPTAGLGGGLFILGLVFGSLLIGIALWRSGVVEPWAAAAVALGGFTHPFLQFNHIAVGIGLGVLAAGCAGVSTVLLRMRNDDFDLPPTS